MVADIIKQIEDEISATFEMLYTWFFVSDVLMNYVPEDKGWSINQNLEHVSLTNHYLLILIRKGTIKAVEKAMKNNHADLLQCYDIAWNKLEAIGQNNSFVWVRPEHMEPTGAVALVDVLAG